MALNCASNVLGTRLYNPMLLAATANRLNWQGKLKMSKVRRLSGRFDTSSAYTEIRIDQAIRWKTSWSKFVV